MDIFPSDAAEILKQCAMAAGESTAEERFGTKGKAAAAKVHWEERASEFTGKMKNLLSGDICNDFKSMFWFQAWRTANERKGYKSDAARDIRDVEQIYTRIKGRNEITKSLADNIHSMGWNIAWYTANTKYGYKDDAVRDKAKYEADYNKIQGEAKLAAMNFIMDNAKVLSQKPKVVSQQTLVNKSTVSQQMEFSFSVTEGKTSSTSHQIAFKYGVKAGVEAGVAWPVKGTAKFEASFEFSHSHTWSESMSNGIQKSYKFPLSVPPNSTCVAKGMVNEAEMEVPYELVFEFGDHGNQKSLKGMWKGVAVSTATYEIEQK